MIVYATSDVYTAMRGCFTDGDTSIDAVATFAYTTSAPSLVTVELSAAGDSTHWVLERDVLITALDQPAVCDEIRLEPAGPADSRVIAITWPSHPNLSYTVPRDHLSVFLARTQFVRLPGSEPVTAVDLRSKQQRATR